ncbi:adhesion G-protein coupled receptor D1-like [Antedon mediterranea]|uniref:adhesion G-protein coupled receptor D1-like n=1 Tax=Antedon mediterranea TaxID=105859 RepID=UPI003AF45457
MTSLSTDMYMSIQYVFHDAEKRFRFFRIFGWIFPLLIVAITVGIMRESYASKSCWLNVDYGVTWAFVVPVILSITIVSLQLSKIGYVAYKKARTPHQSEEEIGKLRQIRNLLYRILLLTPAVGLTWIFGILTLFNDSSVLLYLFVLSTSLQGFLIWFTQCFMSKEVMMAWRKFHNKHMSSSVGVTEIT